MVRQTQHGDEWVVEKVAHLMVSRKHREREGLGSECYHFMVKSTPSMIYFLLLGPTV